MPKNPEPTTPATEPEAPAALPPALEQAVDTWANDLLRNLGPVIPTEAFNHLHAAIPGLKARLALTQKEG